ncbi:hypothetical protein SAMN06265360_13416 [Haloechinothrix alba]|uniref:Uncharacterized protein n=1 Tax=Haloechinothrix alba TaxID=664784 RepID=A0A239AAD9_9PSEU|nr:hypothetical protein [Haloechinothrix alba]SNR92489.1 hypothetical protein SAMN06265360_13416 [Haloechinothrix alba]
MTLRLHAMVSDSGNNTTDPLENLLAIADIRQLEARYAHYTAQKDSESWGDLFTEVA